MQSLTACFRYIWHNLVHFFRRFCICEYRNEVNFDLSLFSFLPNLALRLRFEKYKPDEKLLSPTSCVRVLPATIKHKPLSSCVIFYTFVASESFWISRSANLSRNTGLGSLCLSNKGHSLFVARPLFGLGMLERIIATQSLMWLIW